MSKLWTKRISGTLDATVWIEGRDDTDEEYNIKSIRLNAACGDIQIQIKLSDIEVDRLIQLISEASRGVVKFKDDD